MFELVYDKIEAKLHYGFEKSFLTINFPLWLCYNVLLDDCSSCVFIWLQSLLMSNSLVVVVSD